MRKKFKFGKAFSDQLEKVSFKYGHFHSSKDGGAIWQDFLISGSLQSVHDTKAVSEWRRFFIVIVVIICFTLLFIRIFHLQIVEGKNNRDLADSNRIQVKIIHAPRGVIYDRNGRILAQNEPGFRLVKDATASASHARYIDRDQALKMEVNGDPDFQNLEIDSIRTYPLGQFTAHILGYLSEINSDELKDPNFLNYRLGDKIGRGGVEESYEKILRGLDGGEVIEVDAQGRKIRTLSKTEPISGQNLYLTIDTSLQELAYKKLAEAIQKTGSCCGALIAQDPNTGQIFALVSYPSFDPANLQEGLTALNFPILNRAISGLYPPGSTFKIASSLAGLSSGKITSKTRFEDTGVLSLGPFTFANWYFTEYGRKEEGGIDVVRALKRSNDIFFYRLGQLTGEHILADTAKKMGLGKKLGIDIPGETVGTIPDNLWKVKNIGEIWYPGDTLHMAIGQGYVTVTPLQISNLISQIAANGKQYPPHLALKIESPAKRILKEYKFDSTNAKYFKDSDLELVKKGLSEVPQNGGTAWPFFTFPISTAGKTGTAEFGDPKNAPDSTGRYKTHAWYTSYAPVNDPKIAITVLLEAAGEGSSVASPVAKELYRWYFSPDKNNLIKDLGPIATESARTLGE